MANFNAKLERQKRLCKLKGRACVGSEVVAMSQVMRWQLDREYVQTQAMTVESATHIFWYAQHHFLSRSSGCDPFK